MSDKHPAPADVRLLALDGVTLRSRSGLAFRGARWTWRRGEQWAILGPNGAGKSLLALALCGRAPVVDGEIHYGFESPGAARRPARSPEEEIALLSPHVQRDLIAHESSFYQSRWHSGIDEGQRTVAQFLSQASVEGINPFELGARRNPVRPFQQERRRWLRWLGLAPLLRRKLIQLSNGEQRRVLLAHTLLRSPRLLVLDDPFGGLDVASRARLQQIVRRLMRAGWPVLLITSRPDEIPPACTHLLLVRNHRIVAQGTRAKVLAHPLAQRLDRASRRNEKPHSRPAPPRPRAAVARGSKPLVELNHVTVQLGRQPILRDFTWTLRRGENWALLGPNGSGKTTLLSLIQGDNPQAYALDIRLFGARSHSTQTLWQTRRKIGWLSPELHLHYPPAWSALEVVCSGFFNSVGLHQTCSPRQRTTARRWLDAFGLADRAAEAIGAMSLGDQRLVLLARAVVKRPQLLILDEPCQGLDAAHRHAVLEAVDRWVAQTRAGLIFVTHHAREMPAGITHVLELKAGRIVRAGRRDAPMRPERRVPRW